MAGQLTGWLALHSSPGKKLKAQLHRDELPKTELYKAELHRTELPKAELHRGELPEAELPKAELPKEQPGSTASSWGPGK